MSATRARILLVVTSEHFYLLFSGWILANKQYHLFDTDSEHIQHSREPGPTPTGTVTKSLISVISSSQLLPFGECGEASKLHSMGPLPHFLECELSFLIRSSGTRNFLTRQLCEFTGDSCSWLKVWGPNPLSMGNSFNSQKFIRILGFSFVKVFPHSPTTTGRVPLFQPVHSFFTRDTCETWNFSSFITSQSQDEILHLLFCHLSPPDKKQTRQETPSEHT